MVKDLLRILGTACILTGIALHFLNFTNSNHAISQSETELEIIHLQEKLKQTEEALADLQQASTAAKKPAEEHEKDVSNEEIPTENEDSETNSDKRDSTGQSTEKSSSVTTLIIESGDNSTTVSKKLMDLNVVEDAKLFEAYLVEHNLAQKIQIGEYELNKKMSRKEIASLITS